MIRRLGVWKTAPYPRAGAARVTGGVGAGGEGQGSAAARSFIVLIVSLHIFGSEGTGPPPLGSGPQFWPPSLLPPAPVQDWPGGVTLLIEMCSGLARDEMLKVGALRKLHGDMGGMCR